jgi:outer membrane protein assembly factor BamB
MRKIAFLLLFSTLSFAEGTHSWTQDSYDEFARGTSKNVAILSKGAIELAPAFKQLYNTPATFLWSIAVGSDGAVYVGSGSPARVYRIERDGAAKVIFEPKELQVQSLAFAGNTLYVATSPDGKIYKLTPNAQKPGEYTSAVFFEPGTKYIWQLLAAEDGTLYAATGDRGEIYKIGADGKGAVFFKSDEAHIRSLAFDRDKQLIAGTDGSGLIYRVGRNGEAFVLYSATKKEITSLAVAADGTIFASGIGEKRVATPVPAPAPQPQPQQQSSGTQGPQPAQAPSISLTQAGGSEIYAIAPDGAPSRIWSSRDDLVYALAVDAQGRLLAGTGNKGRLIAVARNGDYVDVAKASANQVIALAPTKDTVYVATSNLGKVFTLAGQPSDEGSFESEVLDARLFSKWGRAEARGSGNYELAVRSGNVDNPDRNWSPWKTVQLGKDGKLDIPAARFLQWRVTFKPSSMSSRVESVKLYYYTKNVAPVIEDIAVQTGARVTPSSPRSAISESVNVSFRPTKESGAAPTPPTRGEGGLLGTKDRGSITVRWSVRDENDDDLLSSVYYRGVNEQRWKLLKDKVADRYYSFDSGLMPDGAYIVRVVATDAPSHAPEDALTATKESDHFEVDNTPPVIESLAAKNEADQLHVSFSANDAMSTIARAEYSVDGGEWIYVEPVGQLSDAKVETYDFNIAMPGAQPAPKPAKGKKKGEAAAANPEETPLSLEHVVVVRVFDSYENSSVAKTIAK